MESFKRLVNTMPVNIRLGLKWLTMANALAYYGKELVTVVKGFMAQAPKAETV